jgi:hypothetical protein
MFGPWRIYSRVSRSEEAEDEDQQAGHDKGINDGGVDGVLLDLGCRVSLMLERSSMSGAA